MSSKDSNGQAAALQPNPQGRRRQEAGRLAGDVQRARDALAIQSGDARRPRQVDPRARTDVDARRRRDHVDRSIECEPPLRCLDRQRRHEQACAVEREPARHGPRQRGLRLEADAERAGAEGARHRGRRRCVDREIDGAHHQRAPARLVVDAHRQLSDVHTAQPQRRHVAGRGASPTRKIERAVGAADDGDPWPHELQACDLDMTQDKAATQREPKAVGVQQRTPARVVHRPEGDVAQLG